MADRATAITDFLAGSPWENWTQTPLAGDASARRYFRLTSGGQAAILMDAPPENGEDTGPFVAIAKLLTQHGLAAPNILLHDPQQGLLLLDDLGNADFAQWLRRTPSDEMALYQAAADVLLKLEGLEAPDHLKRLTPAIGAEMVNILGPY